jgi:uncharacterized membrane protein YedE/YeeE
MNLSPLIKGIITAVAMIAVSLVTYYTLPATSPLHYFVFATYAIGIIWTLIAHRNSPVYSGKFGESFNYGFRCFIVATFLMVLYTFAFNKMHPEFAEESTKLYKEQLLLEKNSSKTPEDIEAETIRYKNGYAMAVVYGSIFGYLIIGVVVTALGSLIITRRK